MPARILVVDDDPLAGELICEILRSAGMDASFLTSSAEAAELLKREKYHAVFRYNKGRDTTTHADWMAIKYELRSRRSEFAVTATIPPPSLQEEYRKGALVPLG